MQHAARWSQQTDPEPGGTAAAWMVKHNCELLRRHRPAPAYSAIIAHTNAKPAQTKDDGAPFSR